jgi:hypothetical protein
LQIFWQSEPFVTQPTLLLQTSKHSSIFFIHLIYFSFINVSLSALINDGLALVSFVSFMVIIFINKYILKYFFNNNILIMEKQSESDNVKTETKLTQVPVSDQNVALNLLVSFVNLAQRRGAFSLDEASKIWECIQKFQTAGSN